MIRARAIAFGLFALVACARAPKAHDAPVTRVVSLSPSTTEAMFAIGAGKMVVGRSRYCDDPPEVLALPQVGGYVDPNLEAILALRPDLVIGARGPAGAEISTALFEHGIKTYFPETESIDAIEQMIAGLGARTMHPKDADAAIARVKSGLAEVDRVASDGKKPRVLLVFGIDPIVVAGPHSFANEMLERAGGENVVREGPTYPTLGIERVLAADPDVVINAAFGEANATSRIAADAPGWREARAVKSGHVVVLTDERVLRPGPRVAEGALVIARALHPDVSAR